MPLTLIKANNQNIFTAHKATLYTSLITACLIVAYIIYISIFQMFTLFVAVCGGALFSIYFIQFKTKTEINAANNHSLLHLKHQIILSMKCNEQFQLHRRTGNTNCYDWETLLNFYNFQTLPTLDMNSIRFLIKDGGDIQLYEQILTYHSKINILTRSLNDVYNYHCVYLEKLNLWESKIKSLKSIRDMKSTDLILLKKKIGENLCNQLFYLTNTIIKTSDSLTNSGIHLIDCIEKWHMKFT